MNITRKITAFAREPLIDKTASISEWYWLLKSQFYYRRFFQRIGPRSRIIKPLNLYNVKHIAIGDNVLIHRYCWLQTLQAADQKPELVIGNGCVIGNFNHITCVAGIHLEEKVLTADRVFITDHGHRFDDSTRPIMDQGLSIGRPVWIGHGSWIGENAVIMSCRIGRNCVIGANAVVLKDIPDYSVAVGAPARVVRRFDPQTNCWEKIA